MSLKHAPLYGRFGQLTLIQDAEQGTYLHAAVDEVIERVQLLPYQRLLGEEGRDDSP